MLPSACSANILPSLLTFLYESMSTLYLFTCATSELLCENVYVEANETFVEQFRLKLGAINTSFIWTLISLHGCVLYMSEIHSANRFFRESQFVSNISQWSSFLFFFYSFCLSLFRTVFDRAIASFLWSETFPFFSLTFLQSLIKNDVKWPFFLFLFNIFQLYQPILMYSMWGYVRLRSLRAALVH